MLSYIIPNTYAGFVHPTCSSDMLGWVGGGVVIEVYCLKYLTQVHDYLMLKQLCFYHNLRVGGWVGASPLHPISHLVCPNLCVTLCVPLVVSQSVKTFCPRTFASEPIQMFSGRVHCSHLFHCFTFQKHRKNCECSTLSWNQVFSDLSKLIN